MRVSIVGALNFMILARFSKGVISLPWILPDASTSVNAFWQLYKKGYLDKEYENVIPIFMWAGSGQSQK